MPSDPGSDSDWNSDLDDVPLVMSDEDGASSTLSARLTSRSSGAGGPLSARDGVDGSPIASHRSSGQPSSRGSGGEGEQGAGEGWGAGQAAASEPMQDGEAPPTPSGSRRPAEAPAGWGSNGSGGATSSGQGGGARGLPPGGLRLPLSGLGPVGAAGRLQAGATPAAAAGAAATPVQAAPSSASPCSGRKSSSGGGGSGGSYQQREAARRSRASGDGSNPPSNGKRPPGVSPLHLPMTSSGGGVNGGSSGPKPGAGHGSRKGRTAKPPPLTMVQAAGVSPAGSPRQHHAAAAAPRNRAAGAAQPPLAYVKVQLVLPAFEFEVPEEAGGCHEAAEAIVRDTIVQALGVPSAALTYHSLQDLPPGELTAAGSSSSDACAADLGPGMASVAVGVAHASFCLASLEQVLQQRQQDTVALASLQRDLAAKGEAVVLARISAAEKAMDAKRMAIKQERALAELAAARSALDQERATNEELRQGLLQLKADYDALRDSVAQQQQLEALQQLRGGGGGGMLQAGRQPGALGAPAGDGGGGPAASSDARLAALLSSLAQPGFLDKMAAVVARVQALDGSPGGSAGRP